MMTSILAFLMSMMINAQQVETTYYENGSVNTHQFYLEGKVIQSSYHLNGQVKEVGEIVKGVPNGVWKTFDDSGKILSEGYFEEGVKVGEWTVKAGSDHQEYRLIYSNGKRIDAFAVN